MNKPSQIKVFNGDLGLTPNLEFACKKKSWDKIMFPLDFWAVLYSNSMNV